MPDADYATLEDDTEDVPPDEQCIWPGCTRRRAPGRAAGSGRQKEYCLRADRPETGGGPVHNARNRWAWRRREPAAGPSSDGAGEAGADGGEPAGRVRDEWPVSTAKLRASELLDQARRQHAAALAAFTAERELYARVSEQFLRMADPASHDLEITAISLKAGRDISAAGEEVARAQRAQLTTERERDDALRRAAEADAAAEQFAEDTEAAERALAARSAEFEQSLAERAAEYERAREELLRQAGDAQERADRAAAAAGAAKTAAAEAIADATARANEAKESAARQIAEAEARAGDASARADAAAVRADAAIRTADERAAVAERRASAADQRATAAERRVSAAEERAETRVEQAAARAAADIARHRDENGQLRAEIGRLREERAAEVARLQAAHGEAITAERARAQRAEDELDALRGSAKPTRDRRT
ncbi:MAG TPA: hypothetical protein VG164_00810 [Trebonia sp.]|nr:hypothetical protein [Trebonia sp.]